jgi:UDP-glucose 4-epimerase
MPTSSILVTGHRGYIGNHFFKPGMTGCDLKDDDFADYGDFADIAGHWFDVVVHLAASVSVVESFIKPEEYLNNNCFKIIRFLQNNRVGRFIFVSTGGALYGNARQAEESQAQWIQCMSPYSLSKYLAEQVVRLMCGNHLILRLANVYGGDYSVRGEASVHAHFNQDNPIIVYGGQQTRDFIHIDQVCAAFKYAIDHDVRGTFNLGSGTETKIIDIAQQFSEARGVPVDVRPARPGEVDFISLDIRKAQESRLLIPKEQEGQAI